MEDYMETDNNANSIDSNIFDLYCWEESLKEIEDRIEDEDLKIFCDIIKHCKLYSDACCKYYFSKIGKKKNKKLFSR